jgi:hypothetical protein
MALFDRDRWQRLQPLLDRAHDLPNERREPLIDEVRATSPELADDLGALLAAEAEADGSGFLDHGRTRRDTPMDAARGPADSIGP